MAFPSLVSTLLGLGQTKGLIRHELLPHCETCSEYGEPVGDISQDTCVLHVLDARNDHSKGNKFRWNSF